MTFSSLPPPLPPPPPPPPPPRLQTPNAVYYESESLRYPHAARDRAFPGPGAYATLDGIAEDKRRWLSTTTWPKQPRHPPDVQSSGPGPAAYAQAGTIGGRLPTRLSSSKAVFGREERFRADREHLGSVHCYAPDADAASPPASPAAGRPATSPTRGTFSTAGRGGQDGGKGGGVSSRRRDQTPGPKYLLRGLADETRAPPGRRRTVCVSSAARFADEAARSPGPIYLAAASAGGGGGGVRLPPSAAAPKLFAFLDAAASSQRSAGVVASVAAASSLGGGGGESVAGAAARIRVVSQKAGGGISAGSTAEIDTASGATLRSGAFGRKTKRDTIFTADAAVPGPQQYCVSEAAVRRTPPAFTFGPPPSTTGYGEHLHTGKAAKAAATAGSGGGGGGGGSAAGAGSAHESDEGGGGGRRGNSSGGGGGSGSGTSSHQKQQQQQQGAPGPGAYTIATDVPGPSFSIAGPREVARSVTPGPAEYSVHTQRAADKPGVPTFSRADRFAGCNAGQGTSDPGPGYYNAVKQERKTKYKRGPSTTCPDVGGWVQRRKQAERCTQERMHELQRRLVIMGTDKVGDGRRLAPVVAVCSHTLSPPLFPLRPLLYCSLSWGVGLRVDIRSKEGEGNDHVPVCYTG